MTDTSQAEFALDQGWRGIAWTRDFERHRAIIQTMPDGQCVWRVQGLNECNDIRQGLADSLEHAHSLVMQALRHPSLIIVGTSGLKAPGR